MSETQSAPPVWSEPAETSATMLERCRFVFESLASGDPYARHWNYTRLVEDIDRVQARERVTYAPMVNASGSIYGTAYFVVAADWPEALRVLRTGGFAIDETPDRQVDIDFGASVPFDFAGLWDERVQNPRD